MPKGAINIDWNQVAYWLEARCSGSQIADILGIHENTLYERCKTDLGLEFVAFKAKNRSKGEQNLRLAQYESAVKDKDRGMQIWLGKQWLGQTDKSQNTIDIPQMKVVNITTDGITEQSNMADPSGL